MTAPRHELRFSATQALGYAVPFGVIFAIFTAVIGDRTAGLWRGLVGAVIAGIVFGLLMERMTRSRRALAQERVDNVTTGLTPNQRRLALVASRRGPAPAEPDVRTAALHIADDRLAQLNKVRVGNLVGPILLLVASGILAITESPTWWIVAAAMLAALAMGVWLRRRAGRRYAMLAGA